MIVGSDELVHAEQLSIYPPRISDHPRTPPTHTRADCRPHGRHYHTRQMPYVRPRPHRRTSVLSAFMTYRKLVDRPMNIPPSRLTHNFGARSSFCPPRGRRARLSPFSCRPLFYHAADSVNQAIIHK